MLEGNGKILQMVACDFNNDLLLDELVLRKKLQNMMTAHCLTLISLREATRETETSKFFKDAIFGNVPLLKSKSEKTTISDYYSLLLKLDVEYRAMECIYHFRCLKKLKNREYSEKFSYYSAHTLGKIEETGQSRETYITKIVELIEKE